MYELSNNNIKLIPRVSKILKTNLRYYYYPLSCLQVDNGLSVGEEVEIVKKSEGNKTKIVKVKNGKGIQATILVQDLSLVQL